MGVKPFYSDYVRHCLRFYARYSRPCFHTEVDKKNWIACDNALKEISENDRKIVLEIYRGADTVSDNIYQIAREKRIDQNLLWRLVNDIERKVAKKRGLI